MATTTLSQDHDRMAETFAAYFREYHKDAIAQALQTDTETLRIDWHDLHQAEPGLAEDYLDQPEPIREAAQAGLEEVPLPIDADLGQLTVRFNNLPDPRVYDVGEYTVDEQAGTFIGIRGQVTRLTQDKSLTTAVPFECQRCGTVTEIPQHGGMDIQEPHECQGCERQGPFDARWTEATTHKYQRARLKRPPETAAGQRDQSIDVDLKHDLVDRMAPGDRVIINSVLYREPEQNNGAEQRTLTEYAEPQSLTRLDTTFEDIDVTAHRDRIEAIASEADPHGTIVDAIAPSIKGYDTIKQALALQLFGGVHATNADGSRERGTSNILLIGDPGLGKSELLKYVKQLAPRAIYTSGKQSTAAGLTAAAVQDDFGTSAWTIEAGAVVEAHKGLCAIDEFDKMSEADQSGLMEAMAHQEVSVSKAGITATLPARTTILAAANPKYGRFDPYEPIAEQINLDPALISRFDLIFTMHDEPDYEADRDLGNHVNRVRKAAQQRKKGKTPDEDVADPAIEPEVLRAYVAHARDIVPELTPAAEDLIADEYAQLRHAAGEDSPIPVTARALKAMHRLAEASARIRLDDSVTPADAERAISIHREFMESVGIDPETGDFDADIIETGTSQAQRDRYNTIETIIEAADEPLDRATIIELAGEEGIPEDRAEHAIENLSQNGEIYDTGRGYRST